MSDKNRLVFDINNIHKLPDILATTFGEKFIKENTYPSDFNTAKPLQRKKIRNKLHPICDYLSDMQDSLNRCKNEGKLNLSEKTIFLCNLCNLCIMTDRCQGLNNVNDIYSRLTQKETFLSACFELEVASYYLDLGFKIEVIPERMSKERTPDFILTTISGKKIHIEAKLIQTKKTTHEANDWDLLIKKLDQLLVKYKRCLKIDILAKIPFKLLDLKSIFNLVEEYCQKSPVGQSCIAESSALKIEINHICEWDKDLGSEFELPSDFMNNESSDIAHLSFGKIIYYGENSKFYSPKIFTVKQFIQTDLRKSVKKNIDAANGQGVQGIPYIVHIGLPNKKSREILDINSYIYKHLLSGLSRNYTKISTLVVQATSLDVNNRGIYPQKRHFTIVPNFNTKNEIPCDFKFLSTSPILENVFSKKGIFKIKYDGKFFTESIKSKVFGDILHLSSRNAKTQIKLILTNKNTINLAIISETLGLKVFDIEVNSKVFIEGEVLKYAWENDNGYIYIDEILVGKINN